MKADDSEHQDNWEDQEEYLAVDHVFQLRSVASKIVEGAVPESDDQAAARMDLLLLSFHIIHPWNMEGDRKRLGPMAEFDDGSGVPNMDQVDDRVIDHCRAKVETTKNPLIKALYSDVLWEKLKRHPEGRQSISAHMALFRDQISRGHLDTAADAVCRAAQLAWMLSSADDSRTAINAIVVELNERADEPTPATGHLWQLARFIEDNLPQFDSASLSSIQVALDRIEGTANLDSEETDFQLLRTMAGLRAKIHRRGRDRAAGHRAELKSGEYLEANAAVRGKTQPLVRASLLQSAVDYYKSIGEAEKGRSLAGAALEAGEAAEENMAEVSAEMTFDFSADIDEMRKVVDQEGAAAALRRIAFDPSTLPTWQSAVDLEQDESKSGSLLTLIPRETYRGGRRVNMAQSVEEIAEANRYQMYGVYEGVGNAKFGVLLSELRETGKLSVKTIIDHLNDGAGFALTDLPFLEAAVRNYLAGNQIEFIHISVPRIEVALVRLAVTLGAPPTKSSAGRVRRIDIVDALRSEGLKALLGEDEIRWLRFVLADERHGVNLRHDVAHGLSDITDMSAQNADRLLHVMLRLAGIREQDSKPEPPLDE